MIPVYSFKSHYLESTLRHGLSMFPGAERLLAVYYDRGRSGLHCLEWKQQDSENAVTDCSLIAPGVDEFIKMRNQNPRSSWLKNFGLNASSSLSGNQLQINSELDNHVLLLRFPKAIDGKNDLLFVFFKNEGQIFHFGGKKQKLSTGIKEVVANMLVRSIDVFRNQ